MLTQELGGAEAHEEVVEMFTSQQGNTGLEHQLRIVTSHVINKLEYLDYFT